MEVEKVPFKELRLILGQLYHQVQDLPIGTLKTELEKEVLMIHQILDNHEAVTS